MNLDEILDFCVSKKLISSNDKNEIRLQGVQSWRQRGYTLLHLICNEVDHQKGDQCPYLIAAKALIEQVGVHPDVFDAHQQSPLHFAAQDGKERLVKMLVRAGADPNLRSKLDGAGMTALEIAVNVSPYAEELINYLVRKTRVDGRMQIALQQTLDDAIENWEWQHGAIDQINVLLHHNLAQRPVFDAPRVDCDEITQGCWVRTVGDVDRELAILRKRDSLSVEELYGHQNQQHPNYTSYSPATFVKSGVSVSLFNGDYAGLVIRRLQRPIDYWYNGQHGEQLTRDFSYAEHTPLRTHRGPGRYHDVLEDDIDRRLTRCFQKNCELSDDAVDRHGVLRAKFRAEQNLPWNEGLFRYQTQNVAHILVNPESKLSAMKALRLRSGINSRHLKLYNYHSSGGASERVYSRDLMDAHHIDQHGNDLDVQEGRSRGGGYVHQTPMAHWSTHRSSDGRHSHAAEMDDEAAFRSYR